MLFDAVIGTCSECGGPVVIPTDSWSFKMAQPRCLNCGAKPKINYAPIIPTEPQRKNNEEFMENNLIFVFGSNRQGRHGAGAAWHAQEHYGAHYGQAEGLQGQSYAIVTKELRRDYPKVTLKEIEFGIAKFLEFARNNPSLKFLVTPVGCGLAGFKQEEIGPFFQNVPNNIMFHEDWKQELISKETK